MVAKRRNGAAKVRYAVVGQGFISQVAILPAFAHAKRNSELVALVSDDPAKLRKLGNQYGVEATFMYDRYEECLQGVDAVFIALPNSMHCEFAVRAARAGVHVLCEKPMAVTSADCEMMIEEAERASTQLMIGYRLHFEQANLEAVALAKSGRLGELRFFTSEFSSIVKAGNSRLQSALGGGPLYDIGIYCINAARYLFRAEPESVFATATRPDDPRFAEVDEMTSVILRFPGDRLASFTCSFGAAATATYRLVGTKGDLIVSPAYEFADKLGHKLTIGGKTKTKAFPKRDQFAPEILYFSDCILKRRAPEPSGREGLADVRIIEALLESARRGRPVDLPAYSPGRRPEPKQELREPPVGKRKLVHASAPHPE